MPTQIIDGFKLNSAAPIDSRMVTSGTSSRNSMSYRYVGLRVYDTAQSKSFVWNGTTWIDEGASELKIAGAKVNFVTKFTENGLTSSSIRESVVGTNRYVGINISDNAILNATLQVGGVVCATTFCGGINGNNILTNTIAPVKLATAGQNGNYTLKSVNNSVQWIQESTTGTVTTQLDTQTTKSFITFVNNTSSTEFKTSYLNDNSFIGADLSTSQLTLSNTNTNSSPAYSFIGSKDTGLYGSSAEVGIALGGNKRIYANSTNTNIAVGSSVMIDTSSTCVCLNANTKVTGSILSTGLSVTGTAMINGEFSTTCGASIGTNLVVTGTTTLNGNVTACGKITTNGLEVVGGVSGLNYISGYTQIWGTTAFNTKVTFGSKIIACLPVVPTVSLSSLEFNQIYRDTNGFLKVR